MLQLILHEPMSSVFVLLNLNFFKLLLNFLRYKKLLLSSTLIITIGIADYCYPPYLNRFHNTSFCLLDRDDQLLCGLLSKDDKWRLPIKLQEVSNLYLEMLLIYEDKRFYYHPGVDPLAMLRALCQLIKTGHVVSGGSTITLQVVRLLEPRPRTFHYKLIEIIRALQLELHFSKKEILEIYLTLAPFGSNIEGIRAASLFYYGKEPKHLNLSEAALLVALPQSPNRIKPDQHPYIAKQFRDKVIKRATHVGILNKKNSLEVLKDTISTKKYPFPRLSPHLAYHLSKKYSDQKTYKTTLSKDLQARFQSTLKAELAFLAPMQTIAALLIHNKTRQVLAYVASADFFDDERQGQVNMIQAIRSPGSTLKPFVYALGFEEEIIHPDTIIEDIPQTFLDYSPKNFDNTFRGQLTIRQALQRSLNIPVVAVLDKIGPGKFTAHLREFGINLKFDTHQKAPSLPIALGGVGISLWDLVSLYTALSNKGEFKPLTLNAATEIQELSETVVFSTLVSPKVAYMVTDILQEAAPPSGFIDKNLIKNGLIAYKTGTSYGYRDAWAIGFSQDYTLGVWVGRSDGTSCLNLTGGTHAAPLLFKLINLLPNNANMGQKIYFNAEKNINEIPHHLKYFAIRKNHTSSNPLKILFPRDGTLLSASTHEAKPTSFSLSLQGEHPPFYVFINGKPLENFFSNAEILIETKEKGFTELTVTDSQGNSVSTNVILQ